MTYLKCLRGLVDNVYRACSTEQNSVGNKFSVILSLPSLFIATLHPTLLVYKMSSCLAHKNNAETLR